MSQILGILLGLIKLWMRWDQARTETKGGNDVADAVEKRADEISVRMHDADPNSVQPDDPRLIRPRQDPL